MIWELRLQVEIQKNAALCGLDDLTFMDTSIKKYPFLNSRASLFSPSSLALEEFINTSIKNHY